MKKHEGFAAMKIGYVARNLAMDCTPSRTFRLASYSEERLLGTLASNLDCLRRTLEFNVANGILGFRISSDLVPFASHPVNTVDWHVRFAREFAEIGAFMRQHDLRISMHPGQYTLINSPNDLTFERSVAELAYHARVLDALGLDTRHKIQIHVGGVYGEKPASIRRFVARFALLPAEVQRRLAIENDDRLYTVEDCLAIHAQIGTPVIFDNLHFALLNNGEPLREAFARANRTWGEPDGTPMIDYSAQSSEKRSGAHAESLDEADFRRFIEQVRAYPFDLMIEIKDKQASALRALAVVKSMNETVG